MNNPQDIFRIAFILIMVKFLIGGLTIFGIAFPIMGGGELGLALAAIGSMHSLSKHVDNINDKKD